MGRGIGQFRDKRKCLWVKLLYFHVSGLTLCSHSSTSSSQDSLYSINHPNGYGDNRNCILTLNFDTYWFPHGIRKWVILNVHSFNMESNFDYFRVVDGNGQHSYTGSWRTGIHRCKLTFRNQSWEGERGGGGGGES